jgi:hypothetical protein
MHYSKSKCVGILNVKKCGIQRDNIKSNKKIWTKVLFII